MKHLLLSALAALTIATASAIPTRRGFYTVTQPDGTTLQIRKIGDEHSHYTLTDDDKLLVKAGGTYYYSNIRPDGTIHNTGVIARPAALRTDTDRAVLQSIDDIDIAGIDAARLQSRIKNTSRAADQSGMGLFTGDFPRTGKIRGLVILVEFQDVKFKVANPHAYFTDMLNKEGFSQYGGTGSARDYHLFNSNGLFDPEYDVFGPVTLPNNMAYYGGNDADGNDKNPDGMVADACKALNDEIDFSEYDFDNDGYVDNVFVFYAGWGEASYDDEDAIWPHSWYVYSGGGRYVRLDGKIIDRYACSNEWEMWAGHERPDGVGTFLHEFSHVMGLPDLYNTENSNATGTPGEWSIMDVGSYNNEGCTPPNYSVFERNALGWTDLNVITGPTSLVLENFGTSNRGYIIPTTKTNEFFLLENRQQVGWDKYLPGHGLLIWHVDFDQEVWDNNEVNNTGNHHRVQIERANNKSSATYESGWAFPGSSQKTSFTNTTTPSMKTWNGTNIDMPITSIAEDNGYITLDVAGGGSPFIAPTLSYTATADGFTVTWNAVENATDYMVSIWSGVKNLMTQNYDSRVLPTGWISNGLGTYTTTGNYATNGCSLKFQKTGNSLTTCTYDYDVNSVKFWYKGQQNIGSYMTISGMIGSSWKELAVLTPPKNEPGYHEITDIPAGVRAIRFVYTKASGNMAVDDITISYGVDDIDIYKHHNEVLTGGATSYHVAVDPADMNANFIATVRAYDGERYSTESLIDINLADSPNGGIDTVSADPDNAPAIYYNLQGIRVDHPAPGNIYIRRQGATATRIRL